MHAITRLIALAALAGMFILPVTASAQEVERLPGNPASPLVPGVMVPAGYNT